CLRQWQTREVFLIGASGAIRLAQRGCKVRKLGGVDDVQAACIRRLAQKGRLDCAVVVNPADSGSGMSSLGPWLATRKRAALLCTGAAGTDVSRVVQQASRRRHLSRLDTLILLADVKAVP